MKAYAHSLRIAPKKANLIAKMIRSMPVPEALEALRRTHKKGARMVETLLKSAVANAEHNDKQDASTLVIRTIIVNQGAGYRRGVPMARGRMRPMRKFLSHISLTLGVAAEGAPRAPKTPRAPGKAQKIADGSSRRGKNTVQMKRSTEKDSKGDSTSSSVSSVPSASSVSSS